MLSTPGNQYTPTSIHVVVGVVLEKQSSGPSLKLDFDGFGIYLSYLYDDTEFLSSDMNAVFIH